MNDELEKEIAKRDGRFKANGVSAELDELMATTHQSSLLYLEGLAKHWYANDNRPIYFDILIENKINGLCYATPEVPEAFDFIGITALSICTIYDLYYRLLSDPRIFPELGNCEHEISDRGSIISLRDLKQNSQNFSCKPIHPSRTALAESLAKLTIRFLLNHEFAHINNGHIAWVRENSSASQCVFIQEMVSNDEELDLKEYRRALEMDADCTAIQYTMNDLRSRHEHLKQHMSDDVLASFLGVMLPESQLYETTLDCFKTTVRVAYFFLRLLDPSQWNGMNIGSHPHLAQRMHYCMGVMFSYTLERPQCEVTLEQAQNVIPAIIQEAENAFAYLLNSEPDFRGFNSAATNDPARTASLNELRASWATMRDSLIQKKRHSAKLA